MEDIGVCVYGVVGVVEVVLVGLAGPWCLADHVKVSISGMVEFLILFEAMLLEAVHSPRQQLEHVGVLLPVLGGLAESLLREVYLVGALASALF